MDVTHIKLAIRHHIAEATKALHHPDLDDEAVHGARKDLKRARSGLRLLRPLDEAAYRRENARLRDAGRWLSGVRDDKVLLGMLAKLLERERKPKGRRLLERLMARLEKERQRDWRAVRTAKRRRELREVLGETAHRVDAWHAPHAHTPVPAAALKQLYRKGRKAFKRSRKLPSDERLHEARKQAKHLGHAVELLTDGKPPGRAKKVLKRASAVGDWLGEDHDLAVVESRFAHLPAAPAKPKQKLERRLEKRRARLQKKALKVARKLYRPRTRRVLQAAA